MRHIGLLLGLAMLASGCMNHISPRKKLAEAVHRVADAARWGRSGSARGVVQQDFWARYVESRRDWEDGVEFADTEVMEVEFGEDSDTAIAVVSYSWYKLSTMTLHRTVVQQQWERTVGDFALSDEQVVKGDASLFADPKDEDGAPRG